MTVIYVVSAGAPERHGILGEVPFQRCIDEFGLDPAQRVCGLREAASSFGREPGGPGDHELQVVAGVGAEEARGDFAPGYYWLDLSPDEARRRLGAACSVSDRSALGARMSDA